MYETEKFLKEHGDKADAVKKGAVEAAIERLKQAVKDEDADKMKAGIEELNKEMQAISADLYAQAKQGAGDQSAGSAQQAAGGAPSEEPPAGKKDDGVIDADFEMVDDKK